MASTAWGGRACRRGGREWGGTKRRTRCMTSPVIELEPPLSPAFTQTIHATTHKETNTHAQTSSGTLSIDLQSFPLFSHSFWFVLCLFLHFRSNLVEPHARSPTPPPCSTELPFDSPFVRLPPSLPLSLLLIPLPTTARAGRSTPSPPLLPPTPPPPGPGPPRPPTPPPTLPSLVHLLHLLLLLLLLLLLPSLPPLLLCV